MLCENSLLILNSSLWCGYSLYCLQLYVRTALTLQPKAVVLVFRVSRRPENQAVTDIKLKIPLLRRNISSLPPNLECNSSLRSDQFWTKNRCLNLSVQIWSCVERYYGVRYEGKLNILSRVSEETRFFLFHDGVKMTAVKLTLHVTLTLRQFRSKWRFIIYT